MNINLKKVISSVAALAMSLSCFTAFAADFSDVADTYSYTDAIEELVALEIVNGYEDGTFKPDNKITRAEVTKMIVAAMGPSFTAAAESSKNSSGFSDVDAVNHWASGYIGIGVAQNFINGMGDGTFAPDANVTYAQIVKMLVSALGYTQAAEMAGGWPNGFLQVGASAGITDGIVDVLGQDTDVTRGQVAKLIRNAVDTPLVVVTSWSTNYITGEPVANTTIMDGAKDSNGNAKAYKTLLTENHDAYVVKGMVDATHATSGTVEVGKIDFIIKNTNSFDAVAYPNNYNASKDLNGVAINGTNAEDFLFTYAEAIIKLDDDDNAYMVCIKPYGKNDIVELDPELYVGANFTAGSSAAPNKFDDITFRKSATTSSVKTYNLEDTAEIYINGVKEKAGELTANTLDAFITFNEVGSVTLIDTPDATASVNGLYDYVMIDFADWAIVDSTLTKNDLQYIYLKGYQVDQASPNQTFSNVGATIILDPEDEDKIYTFIKDGKEVKFEDIKANDVLLVTYDKAAGNGMGTADATGSRFLTIEICDKVVSGQVAGISTDDFGKTVYNVNGANYELVAGLSALTPGTNYDLYLDATGRVVDTKMTATAANYAIIDRVYADSATEEDIIRLIKADGTREAYKAKDTTVYNDAYIAAYDTNDNGAINGTEGNGTGQDGLRGVAQRIVEYKLNSLGEIVDVNEIAATNSGSVAFAANANRVGTVRMDEATKILDLTGIANKVGGNLNDATTYTAADIKAGALTSFVDGELYTVLGYKPSGYSAATFAVVIAGNASVTPITNFAVVNSVGSTYADGITVETLSAYVNTDKTAPVVMVEDEDCTYNFSANLAKGDVVVLTMKGDKIAAVDKIFTMTTALTGIDTVAGYFNTTSYPLVVGKDGSTTSKSFIASGITSWDTSDITDNNWARVGYGVIINNANGVVTMGRLTSATGSEVVVDNEGVLASTTAGDVVSAAAGIEEFDLAADVNVYVYDTTVTGANQLTAAAAGAIRKTVVSDSLVYADATGAEFYDWTAIDTAMSGQLTMNYAFYKVVNDEIVDILVIAQ